jgi:hypothetical protein
MHMTLPVLYKKAVGLNTWFTSSCSTGINPDKSPSGHTPSLKVLRTRGGDFLFWNMMKLVVNHVTPRLRALGEPCRRSVPPSLIACDHVVRAWIVSCLPLFKPLGISPRATSKFASSDTFKRNHPRRYGLYTREALKMAASAQPNEHGRCASAPSPRLTMTRPFGDLQNNHAKQLAAIPLTDERSKLPPSSSLGLWLGFTDASRILFTCE